MTIHIDADKAVELLKEAVKERGEDFVYPRSNNGCKYVINNQPSCLVGVVLSRAGVPIAVLLDLDTSRRVPIIHDGNDLVVSMSQPISQAYLPEDVVVLTDEARLVLTVAQNCQDRGESWGRAVSKASGVRSVDNNDHSH